MVHLKYYYAILFMAMGGLSTVLAVKELKWEVSGYSRASASDVLVNQAKQVAKIVVFHSYKRHRKSPKQNFILELPQTVRKRHTQVAFYAFDCSEKTGVCEDQGIEKYPTLSLYFQGNKHLYRGQFSSAECLSWIGDLLLITAHPVDSLAHFLQEKNGLKDTDNFFVFFCGNPSSPAFSLLNSVSKTRQGDKFYYSKDQVLVEYLGCKENEFLLVRSKETTKYAGKANQALGLEVFILQHKFRNVSIPSLAKHKDFLSDKRPALIFFNDKLDEELLAILDKVGSTVGERVALNYFHETASNKRMVKKINNLVGVTQEHKPCIRLVQFANGLPLRYKMVPEEFKPDKIVMFVERVLLGKEEPYLRSQAVKEHHKYFSVRLDHSETRWAEYQGVHIESGLRFLRFLF
jgi:hypothetical protein